MVKMKLAQKAAKLSIKTGHRKKKLVLLCRMDQNPPASTEKGHLLTSCAKADINPNISCCSVFL